MTNPHIVNPYLRGLAAREIAGWRAVYSRTKNQPGGMDRAELWNCIDVAKAAIGRVDLHLRRHPKALLAGDTTPLRNYPPTFAGHS